MGPFEVGIEFFRNGKYQEAVDVFTLASQENPDNIKIWNALAVALSKSGDNNQALTALQAALKLDPDNPVCKKNLEKIRKKIKQANNSSKISGTKNKKENVITSKPVSHNTLSEKKGFFDINGYLLEEPDHSSQIEERQQIKEDIKQVLSDSEQVQEDNETLQDYDLTFDDFFLDVSDQDNSIEEKNTKPGYQKQVISVHRGNQEVYQDVTDNHLIKENEQPSKIINNKTRNQESISDSLKIQVDFRWIILTAFSFLFIIGILLYAGGFFTSKNSFKAPEAVNIPAQETDLNISPSTIMTSDTTISQQIVTEIPTQEIHIQSELPGPDIPNPDLLNNQKYDDESFYSLTSKMIADTLNEIMSVESALNSRSYNQASQSAETVLDLVYEYTITYSTYSLSPQAAEFAVKTFNITDEIEKSMDYTKKAIEAHDVNEKEAEKVHLISALQSIKDLSTKMREFKAHIED